MELGSPKGEIKNSYNSNEAKIDLNSDGYKTSSESNAELKQDVHAMDNSEEDDCSV